LDPSPQDEATHSDEAIWTVFCDGSWGSFATGAVAFIVPPSKVKALCVVRLQFQCTINIAEYEALFLGLRKMKAMGRRRAVLKSYSLVITG
jgi:ribonuclease HI